jgi:hypothetical protein
MQSIKLLKKRWDCLRFMPVEVRVCCGACKNYFAYFKSSHFRNKSLPIAWRKNAEVILVEIPRYIIADAKRAKPVAGARKQDICKIPTGHGC